MVVRFSLGCVAVEFVGSAVFMTGLTAFASRHNWPAAGHSTDKDNVMSRLRGWRDIADDRTALFGIQRNILVCCRGAMPGLRYSRHCRCRIAPTELTSEEPTLVSPRESRECTARADSNDGSDRPLKWRR